MNVARTLCLRPILTAAFVAACLSPARPQPVPASALARQGLYLARAGDCIACHTRPGGKLFAGGLPMPTPFGTLYSPNITPDTATGIGTWSADSFYATMHTGRAPDGGLLYPAMPFGSYTKVTRTDSDAIFAYLRTVPPVSDANKPNELRFPYDNRSLILGWRTLFFSQGSYAPDTTKSADWNRGAYLVGGLGHCAMCHSAMNAFGGNSQSKAFQGGLIPMQNWYAPSLASDAQAGLGDWRIADITAYLRSGVSQRGAAYGPMGEVIYDSLQYLTPADANAMAVYLKTLAEGGPPDEAGSAVPASEGSLLMNFGKTVYESHCAACHGAAGLGMPPQYPQLAGNQSIQMDEAVNPIRMVLNGGFPPGTAGNPMPYGMPPFAQTLSDNEIAAVVTYIRGAWGNHGSVVTASRANALRAVPLE